MEEAHVVEAEPASLGQVSPGTFGVQVLLEFGRQLETDVERLQQENPKLAQKFIEKKKP